MIANYLERYNGYRLAVESMIGTEHYRLAVESMIGTEHFHHCYHTEKDIKMMSLHSLSLKLEIKMSMGFK